MFSMTACNRNCEEDKKLKDRFEFCIKSVKSDDRNFLSRYVKSLTYLDCLTGIPPNIDIEWTTGEAYWKSKKEMNADIDRWEKWYSENHCGLTLSEVDSIVRTKLIKENPYHLSYILKRWENLKNDSIVLINYLLVKKLQESSCDKNQNLKLQSIIYDDAMYQFYRPIQDSAVANKNYLLSNKVDFIDVEIANGNIIIKYLLKPRYNFQYEWFVYSSNKFDSTQGVFIDTNWTYYHEFIIEDENNW